MMPFPLITPPSLTFFLTLASRAIIFSSLHPFSFFVIPTTFSLYTLPGSALTTLPISSLNPSSNNHDLTKMKRYSIFIFYIINIWGLTATVCLLATLNWQSSPPSLYTSLYSLINISKLSSFFLLLSPSSPAANGSYSMNTRLRKSLLAALVARSSLTSFSLSPRLLSPANYALNQMTSLRFSYLRLQRPHSTFLND